MSKIKFCIIFISFFYISSLIAHPGKMKTGRAAPVRPVDLQNKKDGPEKILRSGFGHIASGNKVSSEAEAKEWGIVSCKDQDFDNYFACLDDTQSSDLLLPKKWRSTFIPRYITPAVLDLVRKKAIERMMIERAVLVSEDKIDSFPNGMPSCLKGQEEYFGKIKDDIKKIIKSELLQKKWNKENEQLGQKLLATNNLLSGGNLIRSVLFRGIIKEQQQQNQCSHKKNNHCADLSNQLQLLEDNPALLFSGNKRANAEGRFQKILQVVETFLGHFDSPTGASLSERRAKGQKIIKDFGEDRTGLEDLLFNQMAKSQGQNIFKELQEGVAQVKKDYIESLEQDFKNICELNLKDFIASSPNTVRQALIDFSDGNEMALKLSLCAEGLGEKLAPIFQCEGILEKKGSGGERYIQSNSQMWTYPYGASNNFSLFYDKIPPLVRMNINIISSYNPREKFREEMKLWKKNLEDFYNCESGFIKKFGPVISGGKEVGGVKKGDSSTETMEQRNCPRDEKMPKMRFEFDFDLKFICVDNEKNCLKSGDPLPTPNFYINQCYHADLKAPLNTNCQEVKKYEVEKCIKKTQRAILVQGASNNIPEFDLYLKNQINPLSSVLTEDSPYKRNACPGALRFEVSTCASLKSCEQAFCLARATCHKLPLFITEKGKQIICANSQNDLIAKSCDGRLTEDGLEKNRPIEAGDYKFDREDAGSLTTKTPLSVLVHEFGHRLGLDDEYEDPLYPVLPLGEADSIMAGASENGRMYPRHFNKMLNVIQCLDKKGPK